MKGINERIELKILEKLGPNPPEKLTLFFREILELEVKREYSHFTKNEMNEKYKILIRKFAEDKSIQKYLAELET